MDTQDHDDPVVIHYSYLHLIGIEKTDFNSYMHMNKRRLFMNMLLQHVTNTDIIYLYLLMIV